MVIGAISSAQAADVVWASPQPIAGPGDIITDGELVAAVNEGNSGVIVDPGGLNLSFSSANDFPQNPFNSGNLGSGDAGFDTILDQADWGNTDVNPHSVSIGGLSVGETYDIQMFVSDIRGCCNGRSMEITGGANTATVYMGDNGGSPNPPHYVVGTFTADSTSQDFSFLGTHPSAGNLRHPQLNAYVLQRQTGPAEPTGDHPFISELVAVGNTTRQDEDGDTPDWLEIYNPTGADIDLAGYHLTDDPNDLTKWTFPAAPLQAGRYLVVYASDKNRAVAGSELHLNFKLASGGDYLALVEPDGSTIVSEYAPSFPAQFAGFSYGIGGLAPDDPAGYFASPSPGSNNGTLLSAPLVAPLITPACATFDSTLQVTLAPALEAPGIEIRYTTNGSAPTSSSTLYGGSPITLSATTHLRARAFETAGGGGGDIASGAFEKLATSSNLGGIPAPTAFTSNLPIMVVENFGAGGVPGPGATLQTARVSVFEVDPATGRSALASRPDACFRIGIRRRGQSSSGFSKPQYRVELRDESDVDLDYPLLGLPSESDWVFNGPWTDKALIRNSLSFELGRTIGVEAPRTKHFEMFLSTNGGNLTSSEYVGVYVLFEKIKQGRNRTDITAMGPSDNAAPEVTGGYMMRFEPPGIANDGPRATGWNTVEILEPSAPTSQQRDYLGGYYDDFVATLNWSRGSGPNNSGIPNKNPLTGYPAYIDVDSFVNLLVVTELGRDQDAYVRSDYMFKDRGGKLHKGPLWDHNLIMGTGCCFDNRNTAGWQYQDSYNRGGRDHAYEPDWIVPLLREPDFKQQFIDRWTELRRGGVLEMTALFDRIDAQADPLAEAAVRNFAKWNTLGSSNVGFPTPATATWEQQIDFIKDWLTQRMAWIDSQFLEAPTLTPRGGQVAAGAGVAVASSENVYFTTDGSDPRLPGGTINPAAQMLPPSGGDVPITVIGRGAGWRYLDDGSDQGASDVVAGAPGYDASHWKHPAFDDSSWSAGNALLGFGGISGATIATEIDKGPTGEQHRTYYFRKTVAISGAAQVLSLGCELLRDDGAIIYLNGKEVARSNMLPGAAGFDGLAEASVGGADESMYHQIDLDPADLVEGDNVIAVEVHQGSSGSSDLGFDFALSGTVPPGGTPSITVGQTLLVSARSRNAGGEWSGLEQAVYVVGTPADAGNLAVTEINYHPSDPTPADLLADPTLNDDDFEWLELRNISGDTIDLSGATFVDAIEFTFPAGTTLGAGEYLAIVENLAAFERRYGAGLPVAGVYANKLRNDGETVRLVGIGGDDIFHFTFNDIWYRPTDGEGYTLNLVDEGSVPVDYGDPAAWGISCELLGTPGGPNGGALSQTFEGWLNGQFTEAERADPAISGLFADLDHDTVVTLLEFALGLDPKQADASQLPEGGIVSDAGDEYLSLTFQRLKKAIGLRYRVEVASNLSDWTEATTIVGAPVENGDGTESVTVRDSHPISGQPHRQIRLRVEETSP